MRTYGTSARATPTGHRRLFSRTLSHALEARGEVTEERQRDVDTHLHATIKAVTLSRTHARLCSRMRVCACAHGACTHAFMPCTPTHTPRQPVTVG